MSKPPLKKLPKKKSLGVHVKMHTERFSRKMLSIAVNQRDGGVMVTPLLENWGEIICSQLTVPPEGGLLPDEASYVSTGSDNKPKLHYHRSGMSSVQPAKFQGGEGRRTIHLPSMEDLDGVQIFSITARLPGRLPWNNIPRKGDIFNIMDQPEVLSLLVSGVICQRSVGLPCGRSGDLPVGGQLISLSAVS